ncbi:uncharacterized protein LOC124543368 isoform X2 [Vanessa cardui]|uniref:uncharacterized protein LOC124543368 isoform X2 n=1 Tax=Vanessa cardui TaxID=171605 RepID=UPI001F12C9D3|nr:uncharacterized protein LOC124543368 isoform X2 [Vanessa cardui]
MVIKENSDSEIEYNGFEVSKARKRQHKKRNPKNSNHRNSCQEHTCINNNETCTSSSSSSSNSQLLQRFNESIQTRELHHNSEEPATYAPHHSSVPFEEQNNFIVQPCTPTYNQCCNIAKEK